MGIGAGGHAKVLIEAIRLSGTYEPIALLDPNPNLRETSVLDVPVQGDDGELVSMHKKGIRYFFVGVGSVADCSLRRRLYKIGLQQGMKPISIIHPAAVISPSALLGPGAMVLAGAVINASVSIGENVIVNTAAVVEHDCLIGDHVHIATGAKLASAVRVGSGAHIGANAAVRQSLTIGVSAIVGVGAAVVSDVAANTIVVGVPARILRGKTNSG